MANFLDTFARAAGNLVGTTSDSGNVWAPSGVTVPQLSGANTAYGTPGSGDDQFAYTDWVPPTPNYRCEFTCGPAMTANSTARAGPTVRHSGVNTAQSFYELGIDLTSGGGAVYLLRWISGSGAFLTGFGLASLPLDTERFALEALGIGATVTLNAYRGNTLLGTYADTDVARIVTTGSAGIKLTQPAGVGTDVCRRIAASPVLTFPWMDLTPIRNPRITPVRMIPY